MLSSLCVILYESIFILSTLINVYCNLLFSGREGGVFSGFQYCCLQWQEVVFWHFEVELKGFLKRKTKKKSLRNLRGEAIWTSCFMEGLVTNEVFITVLCCVLDGGLYGIHNAWLWTPWKELSHLYHDLSLEKKWLYICHTHCNQNFIFFKSHNPISSIILWVCYVIETFTTPIGQILDTT